MASTMYRKRTRCPKADQTRVAYQALSEKEPTCETKRVERDMLHAAKNLEFERAAELRDRLKKLKQRLYVGVAAP